MPLPFAAICEGLPYGWSILYAAVIEGCSTIFDETDRGQSAPAGYTLDHALIVDDSLHVGTVVDRETGLGRGFDLTIRLDETATVKALVSVPALRAKLTASMTAAATTANVDDTTGWAASGTVAIGRELCPYSGKTGTSFTGLTRGTYGRAYAYDASSSTSQWLTPAPLWMTGREVRLYAIPVDPWGHVSGANLLSDAGCMWMGHIEDPPVPEDDGFWTIGCRSLDRKLADPCVPSITGTATWDLEPDPLVKVTLSHIECVFGARIGWTGASAGAPAFDFQPWATLVEGTAYRHSALRALVKSTFETAMTAQGSSVAATLEWRGEPVTDGAAPFWRWSAVLVCDFSYYITDPFAVAAQAHLYVRGGSSAPGFLYVAATLFGSPVPDTTGGTTSIALGTGLTCRADVAVGSLEVTLDEPATVPTSGWVILDGPGGKALYRYTSTDTGAGTDKVTLFLDPTAGPSPLQLTQATIGEGAPLEVSVTIAHRLQGLPSVAMMTLIESSGRGTNGTCDTDDLGLDLDAVEEVSFAIVLGSGWFQALATDLVVDEEASFADLFGGLLALSRTAIVAVPTITGEGVYLTAVSTANAEIGPYTATITDNEIASAGGGSPVRALRQVSTPTAVAVEVTTFGADKPQKLTIVDVDRQRAEGIRRWELEIPGYDRAQLVSPATQWAGTMLALGRTAQAVEVDCVPWVQAEIGDAVYLDTVHWAVYQRSNGERGYTGAGRVIGRTVSLTSQIVTLTLLIDGLILTSRLCPAAPVLSFTGAGAAVDTVNIPLVYLPHMLAALAVASPIELVAYLPGSDTTATCYQVSAAAEAAGECVLTVDSQTGAFTLTAAWFLTWPTTAVGNASQDAYMHTDLAASWG